MSGHRKRTKRRFSEKPILQFQTRILKGHTSRGTSGGFFESLFPLFPIRQVGAHETLEDFAVVRGEAVNEFVDNYELAQFFWQLNQFGVQSEATNTRNRGPLAVHFAHVNLRRFDSNARSPMPDSPTEFLGVLPSARRACRRHLSRCRFH